MVRSTDGLVPTSVVLALAVALAGAAEAACPAPSESSAWVSGGTFTMGNDDAWPEEGFEHRVTVTGFWIDRHEVTNREFGAFVAATGYRTKAETGLDPAIRPDLPPELLRPGGMVFAPPANREGRLDPGRWWSYVAGADWRHPTGPASTIEGKDDHPVVQVAHEDALAYARWRGRDLPTEAEWERAARGGLDDATYAWGDRYDPVEGWRANTWQGAFPTRDDGDDGFHGTSPVGSFPPNGYGLVDMAGNVWEYARDWYARGHDGGTAIDPVGPDRAAAAASGWPDGPQVVIKGGSWLCSPDFCLRYRPSARQGAEPGLGTSHVGFRTVLRPVMCGGTEATAASRRSRVAAVGGDQD